MSGGHSRRIDHESHGDVSLCIAEPQHFARGRAIVATSPVLNIHVGARLAGNPDPRHPGHEMWALLDGERVVGLAHRSRGMFWALDRRAGVDTRVIAALARAASSFSSMREVIFGPEPEVEGVAEIAGTWGIDLLEIRRQAMMACPVPILPPAPQAAVTLRQGRRIDLRWLLEAHAQMCREDLGIDQVARNPEGYQRYFIDLIRRGRVYLLELDGVPVAKAEIPLISSEAWLIEGVFTVRAQRGRGFGSHLTAELARQARARGRVASLYVHRRNASAIRIYESIGFETLSEWATGILGRERTRPQRPREW